MSTKRPRASQFSANLAKDLWRSLGRPVEDLKAFLRSKGVSRLIELEKAAIDELIAGLEKIDRERQVKEAF